MPGELFTRPEATYDMGPEAVEWILKDPANPLYRVSRVIPDSSRVLDVGAGNGLLARVLDATHSELVIDGIEPNPYGAELARPHYRELRVGYFQDFSEELREQGYDYIVLADVIEHVADPLALLRDLRDIAGDRSRIVISTPNVAFGSSRMALMRGRFDYVDSGLLERTHLRFFTYRTLLSVFAEAGLLIEHQVFHQKNLLASEIPVDRSMSAVVDLLRVRRDDLAHVYQFFFVLSTGTERTAPVERYGDRTTIADILAWYASPRRLFSPP
jgi:2-polyprenyl-3-methyl-5-hydroxy-6-metoxy-1,4-benzoquinol methylase